MPAAFLLNMCRCWIFRCSFWSNITTTIIITITITTGRYDSQCDASISITISINISIAAAAMSFNSIALSRCSLGSTASASPCIRLVIPQIITCVLLLRLLSFVL
jgi:hypothetical protein